MTAGYDYAEARQRIGKLRELAELGDVAYFTCQSLGRSMADVLSDNDFSREDLPVIGKAMMQLSGMIASLVSAEPDIDPLAICAILGVAADDLLSVHENV
jgi:hypothetical protein